MWDLIVSVPDHCLSFYFSIAPDVTKNVTILYTSHRPLSIPAVR